MTKNRLEAFSDGVLAIVLTIMVLELKVPQPGDAAAFHHLGVQFLSYVISFVYVAIYWNNHHHMLHTVQKVNGKILWMNTLLLFSLSLFPFSTAWVGESNMASLPVFLYGAALLAAALAYYALSLSLIALHGPQSVLAKAVGTDFKGRISLLIYVVGMAFAYWLPWVAYAFYMLGALLWLVPDRRIERALAANEGNRKRR